MREDLEISETDKKGDMEFTEDKLNDDICPDDAPEVKRLNADVFGGVEVGKEGTWSSSKDIVARDNERRKTCNTQAKKSRRGNCSGSKNALPTVPVSNRNPVGSGFILSGIPLPARSREPRPGVIFVFENASLVLAKVNKSYQIINPDEHAGFMKKHNLNRSDYRPDIIHEVLARLLGSRLNLTGGIQAVPFLYFAKSCESVEYFDTIGSAHPLVFVIGAMAHGKIDSDCTDDFIADLFSIVFLSGMPVLDGPSSCNTLDRIPAATILYDLLAKQQGLTRQTGGLLLFDIGTVIVTLQSSLFPQSTKFLNARRPEEKGLCSRKCIENRLVVGFRLLSGLPLSASLCVLSLVELSLINQVSEVIGAKHCLKLLRD
ncbi:UNVERIFIED_CONTAM: Ribosomal RNA small subunit methyltransferase NEP1 [Sesamum calycinum]|uniref:Ribosomal RNA small subunit methyltransferase NEP1 n=1 Tax=Sesamum calycinum TaxID=2727403 RepID=A0AAW2RS81_9LAMI